MTRWIARVAALLAASVLLLSACGDGRSDDGSGGTDTTTDSASTATGVAQFGDLESPCGPGEPSGSPDQAVTDSTITIGYGDDAGYQATPGLGHEASDAVKAMIDWCNEQGGINGRTIVGEYYDAKITEMANVMTEACSKSFFLVGSFFALPESAEQTRIECGLPVVPGIVSGSGLAMAPLMVSPAPQPIDQFNVGSAAELAKAFPAETKKAAVMAPQFPNITAYVQRFIRTAPTVGWEFIGCDQSYPITGVTDWRPYLQLMKDCGVEAVMTLNVGTNMQNTLDAAAQIDFDPIWLNAASAYAPDLAGGNASGNGDRFYFGNSFVPLDDTPEGSANATYVELVTAAGGDVAYSGQVSTSAFLLWATAARACGNDLTRDCVMQELKSITEWDAGGLSSPQDPGGNNIDSCTVVMKMEGTAFIQWQPTEPGEFVCDPSWAAEVQPPVDAAAELELGPDRVATNITG